MFPFDFIRSLDLNVIKKSLEGKGEFFDCLENKIGQIAVFSDFNILIADEMGGEIKDFLEGKNAAKAIKFRFMKHVTGDKDG